MRNRYKHHKEPELESTDNNNSLEENQVCSATLLKMMGMTILDIVKLKKTGNFFNMI